MSLASTAISSGLTRKPVYFDGSLYGRAATLYGVRQILRAEGFPWIADALEQHCVEERDRFVVTREKLAVIGTTRYVGSTVSNTMTTCDAVLALLCESDVRKVSNASAARVKRACKALGLVGQDERRIFSWLNFCSVSDGDPWYPNITRIWD